MSNRGSSGASPGQEAAMPPVPPAAQRVRSEPAAPVGGVCRDSARAPMPRSRLTQSTKPLTPRLKLRQVCRRLVRLALLLARAQTSCMQACMQAWG